MWHLLGWFQMFGFFYIRIRMDPCICIDILDEPNMIYPCNHILMYVCTCHMHVWSCPCSYPCPTTRHHAPWSNLRKRKWKSFSSQLNCFILSYCSCHTTTLAPCMPSPPSSPHHAHLLHLESPTFPNLFPLSFVTYFFWGRIFGMCSFSLKASGRSVHLA